VESKYKRASQVPGFSTSAKTRPLIINKIEEDMRQKELIIHSSRLAQESDTFIWYKGKAQAMSGYNDDLIMSLAIGLYVRATTLRINDIETEASKRMLGNFGYESTHFGGIIKQSDNQQNPYKWTEGGEGEEDLDWLLK